MKNQTKIMTARSEADYQKRIAELEKESDYYEGKSVELQRKLNQVEKSFQEYSMLVGLDALDAAYARSCPHCQKRKKRKMA